MTKCSVEEVSPIERRLHIEVPPDVVSAELDDAYKMLSRRVKVPGFRPGKTPRRILEARFKDQVESDVIQHLVETSYHEAIEANPQVHPVASPRVTNEGLKLGEPFRYQARVEVKPKVEPKDYDGLELKKKKVEITDQTVDAEVERLRKAVAEVVPVEGRAAQQDDLATIDFEGNADGKPFPGSKGDGVDVELTSGVLSDGKAPELVGMSVGESREIRETFPADYRVAELAGKQAVFNVVLKGLKARKELSDDALAKELNAGETLADLKNRIRKEMTERATEQAKREEREQLLQQLVERNPFEVPSGLVEQAMGRRFQSLLEGFMRQGIDPRRMRVDFEQIRENMREPATRDVKSALLLEAVADKENVQVTDEDVNAKLKELSTQLDMPEEKVRATVLSSPENEKGFRLTLRDEKTLAFLSSKAKISDA